MPTDPFPTGQPTSSPASLGAVRDRWGWIVAFGVLCAALGVVALGTVVASTIASVFLIGTFMIIAGAIEIGLGINARTPGRKALWVVAGLLNLVAGAFALAQPLLAATVFTLLIGSALLATGVMRIVAGVQMHDGPKAPVILSGLVTTLLGILIVAGWPASSLVVLGTFLGIDLMLYGLTWIATGLRLRAS